MLEFNRTKAMIAAAMILVGVSILSSCAKVKDTGPDGWTGFELPSDKFQVVACELPPAAQAGAIVTHWRELSGYGGSAVGEYAIAFKLDSDTRALVETERLTLQPGQQLLGLDANGSIVVLEGVGSQHPSILACKGGKCDDVSPKGFAAVLNGLKLPASDQAGAARRFRRPPTVVVDSTGGVVVFVIDKDGSSRIYLGFDGLASIDDPPQIISWGTAQTNEGMRIVFLTAAGKLLVADTAGQRLKEDPNLEWAAAWRGIKDHNPRFLGYRALAINLKAAYVQVPGGASAAFGTKAGAGKTLNFQPLGKYRANGHERSEIEKKALSAAPWLLAREGRSAPLDTFSLGDIVALPLDEDSIVLLDSFYYRVVVAK